MSGPIRGLLAFQLIARHGLRVLLEREGHRACVVFVECAGPHNQVQRPSAWHGDVQAERDEMSGSRDTHMYRQVRDAARRLTEGGADFRNDQLRAGSRQGIDVQVVRAGSGAVQRDVDEHVRAGVDFRRQTGGLPPAARAQR